MIYLLVVAGDWAQQSSRTLLDLCLHHKATEKTVFAIHPVSSLPFDLSVSVLQVPSLLV